MEPAKKGKICDALGKLGIYTRSCHFHSFDQPEAKIPTHVFAISEKKLLAIAEERSDALRTHNKSFLLRAYPKGKRDAPLSMIDSSLIDSAATGTRISSSNLDPVPCWQHGIQMVALNWQELSDEAMMLNDAMFAGTGGWVLKPVGLRAGDTAKALTSRHLQRADLTVRVLAAQRLDQEAKFEPDAYVKCELLVGNRVEKRVSQTRHSRDPDFSGEVLTFDDVRSVEPETAFLRYVLRSLFFTAASRKMSARAHSAGVCARGRSPQFISSDTVAHCWLCTQGLSSCAREHARRYGSYESCVCRATLYTLDQRYWERTLWR